MQLIQTTILQNSVRMRYADHADPAKATEWLDFQVPIEGLTLPNVDREVPLGDHESRFLGSIQQAALRRVRDLIGEETQALASRVGRKA